ncbi:MAG: hypothetical protein JO002_08535 [Burkholderiaceae bacterium]|nr:hypothetical protein [Burkholderiaceae bacterium]
MVRFAKVLAGKRVMRLAALAAMAGGLSACGVMAAPCRVTSAALKMVPVVGHVAAVPTDACAAVIDP